ncbi:hypothetical protein IVB27_09430 [Bradyrhizobium sp. 197]|uniref:hypothetical protein n=1 Tax=Bradyrhizobium sp. 197 TaxID=2782663 RepID=UPI001FF9C71E|nr:hypothetical protein [Bradyrhizobium sp. 197]MCK1475014.1 hypothetical protein [Bradyrhizobium sp. 197]
MPKKNSTLLIEYDQSARETLAACIAYLKEAGAYQQGKRRTLPDASRIVRSRFPASSILQSDLVPEARGLPLPAVSAVIHDPTAESGKARSNRYFDPWYFVVMLLMEIPGGRFRFDWSKRKYLYLAYAAPGTKEGNFYLRRIVANTPALADTREQKDGGHYDYRRATLRWVYKDVVRAMGQDTRRKARVRESAIQFAVELFKRQLAAHGKRPTRASKMPGLNVTLGGYEELLRYAVDLADAVHERFLLQGRDDVRR